MPTTKREGETVIQKKEENGEKYVTATTEAEFHAALNRGFAVEVTWELAEIDQARNDRHD